MASLRGAGRALILAVAAATLFVALGSYLAPIVARHLIIDYLERAGVSATIDRVTLDPWTGTLVLESIHARGANGDGFRAARLRLSLRYAPLASKHVVLRRAELRDAALDLRAGHDGTLRAAGVALGAARGDEARAGGDWGLGVDALDIAGLRLRYHQGAARRDIVVRTLSAESIETWRPENRVSIAAELGVAGGRVRIEGRLRPFGRRVRGQLRVDASEIAPAFIDGLAAGAVPKLGGRLNGHLDTTIGYASTDRDRRDAGTTIAARGALDWRDAELTRAGGLRVSADRLRWQGRLALVPNPDPARADAINADGALRAAALVLEQPAVFRLAQARAEWQGETRIVRRARTTQITTDGALNARAAVFALADTARLDADRLRWRGHGVLEAGLLFERRADGTLRLDDAALSIARAPAAARASRLVFDGRYGQTAEDGTLVTRVNGGVNARDFAVRDTAIDADWLAADRLRIERLRVGGLGSIGFKNAYANRLRVMTDTDTSASVLTAAKAKASRFRLEHRRAYRLARLDIDGARFQLRRDAGGLGVISEYLPGIASATASAPATKPHHEAPGPTFALDHLAIAGPAIAFTDVVADPDVVLRGTNLQFSVDAFDSARPARRSDYRLSLDVGDYGHLDSRGSIAPLAPRGLDMLMDAWLRSLSTAPLSGYLNAAMGRRIANGAADGTLHLQAVNGSLNGVLDATLANFRLADTRGQSRTIAFGISLNTALALVRGQNDVIHFKTAILGDIENPYFSLRNLIREAVLAGLRTALLSDFSPIGLLNKAKNGLVDLLRSLASRPVAFAPGKHYVPPAQRDYLGHLARTLRKKSGLGLRITGHAAPADASALAEANPDGIPSLSTLAGLRAQAVRDYLAARDVDPARLRLAEPTVDRGGDARPRVTFTVVDP